MRAMDPASGPPTHSGTNAMQRTIIQAGAALALFMLAGNASAYSFTPTKTTFTATGTLMLTALGDTVSCNTKLGGKTSSKGAASITSAAFSGKSAACALITPTDLPWKAQAR